MQKPIMICTRTGSAEHPEFKEQSGLLETLKEMEVFPQKWLKENGNQLSNLCVAIRGGK